MSERLHTSTGRSREQGPASCEPGLRRVLGVIKEKVVTIMSDDPSLKFAIIEAAYENHSFAVAAEQVIPESFVIDPRVAESVVAGVLREALTPEDYAKLTARNILGGRRKAAKAARDAVGVIEWSPDETMRLQELAQLHRHEQGRQKGRPNCVTIASIINNEFHGGETVRSAEGASKILSQLYKEGFTIDGAESVATTDWSEEEDTALESMMETMLHEGVKWYSGRPDYEAIAAALNKQFHGGEAIRNSRTCGKHATLLRRRHKRLTNNNQTSTKADTEKAAVRGLSELQGA